MRRGNTRERVINNANRYSTIDLNSTPFFSSVVNESVINDEDINRMV
jgi:hypothetical protein